MSVRRSAAWPRACSGLMYAAVPRIVPVPVTTAAPVRAVRLGRFDPGQAEVEHLDEAIGGDRDVRGLEIPMHDAVLMGRFERAGDLPRDGQGLVECQRAACGQVLLQRDARDELEDEAGEAVSLFEAEERRDVRMVE